MGRAFNSPDAASAIPWVKQRYDSGGFRAVNFSAKNRMEGPVYAGLALRRGSKLAKAHFRALFGLATVPRKAGVPGYGQAWRASGAGSGAIQAATIAGELLRQAQRPSPGAEGQEISNLQRERHIKPANGRTAPGSRTPDGLRQFTAGVRRYNRKWSGGMRRARLN